MQIISAFSTLNFLGFFLNLSFQPPRFCLVQPVSSVCTCLDFNDPGVCLTTKFPLDWHILHTHLQFFVLIRFSKHKNSRFGRLLPLVLGGLLGVSEPELYKVNRHNLSKLIFLFRPSTLLISKHMFIYNRLPLFSFSAAMGQSRRSEADQSRTTRK